MSNDIEKQDDVLAAMIETFTDQKAELETKDDDHFCNWYLRIVNQAKADEDKVKEMAATMLREISNRRKALQYVYGQQFRDRVTAVIETQPGKKKSVNYLMGSAGFRTTPESIEISDVEKAKEWAVDNFAIDELKRAISGIEKTTIVVATLFRYIETKSFAGLITDLNKTPFFNHIKATGEIPPGVELIDKFDKFTINGKVVDDTPLLPEPDLPTAEDVRGILEEKKE